MRTDDGLRRAVIRTVLWSTLAFFMVLGGAYFVRAHLPAWREARVERLLERGDTAAARSAAGRVDDEAAAQEYLTRCDYMDGEALMETGDWAAARELFARCGTYADAQEQALRCDYLLADAMASGGDWAGAADAFSVLGAFSNAAARARECRYELALVRMTAGDKTEAGELLSALGDYRDAPALLRQIAVEYTGLSDPEAALQAYMGLSAGDWERMKALEQARLAIPRGVVDVGFYHTVGLADDGTVLACGDNAFGQCDVSGLRGAVAVAAGAYHTAALFPDGTVRAVGRNSEGQCATESWRDVVRLAAADYATLGLTADGRVLYAGCNDYSELADWSGLTDVIGGSYNAAVLSADGSVWISPRLNGQERLDGCVALAVNTGFAVGIMKDGSTVSTAFDLSPWQDIIAVDAGATAVLGLDVSGRVHGFFFRQRDAVDLEPYTQVTALAAGGTHHALVMADGTVTVLGDVSHGEGDVAGWVLKIN